MFFNTLQVRTQYQGINIFVKVMCTLCIIVQTIIINIPEKMRVFSMTSDASAE